MMMFWKRNGTPEGGMPLPPEPTPSSGRPSLAGAFTEELRNSVRELEEQKKIKKGRFNFLKKKSHPESPGRASPSPAHEQSPGRKSPFRFGGKNRLSAGKKEMLPVLEDLEEEQSETSSMEAGYSRQQAAPSPQQRSRYRVMSPTMADELKMSVHGRETKMSTSRQRTAPGNRQRLMDKAMADELKRSVHGRHHEQGPDRYEIEQRLHERREVHQTMAGTTAYEKTTEELQDEQASRARVPSKAYTPNERPRMKPELFNELKQSIHSRSTRNFGRRQQIKERIMKRRQSRASLHASQDLSVASVDFDTASFAEESALAPLQKEKPETATRRKGRKKKSSKDASQHSLDTFQDESIESPDLFNLDVQYDKSTNPLSNSTFGDLPDEVLEGDFDDYRSEWARLTREKKRLRSEVALSKKKVNVVALQVADLKSENRDLRKQLATWQGKTSQISKRQSQDQLKADSALEQTARARVDLTKSLNENAALKSRVHDLGMALDEKEVRLESFQDTIQDQARKIEHLSATLKDAEAELRYNVDEKKRIEEELAVVTASSDGQDVSEAIHQLDEEKANWLEEKDRALEAKRMALEEESSRLTDREKRRYQEDAEQLQEATERTRQREEDDRRMQQNINRQLRDLEDLNHDLQEQLKLDHADHRLEMKKKDQAIEDLHQEVSKMQRKFAASLLREQDALVRQSEVETTKESLKDSKRHHRLLEKQIKKLKKDRKEQKGDWREVILPGYRNMKGVTFGAPSDELAGFLTILVEDQKAKQKQALSSLQKEIKKYLKSPGKGKSKKKKSKEVSTKKGAKSKKAKKTTKGKHKKKSKGKKVEKKKAKSKKGKEKKKKTKESAKKRRTRSDQSEESSSDSSGSTESDSRGTNSKRKAKRNKTKRADSTTSSSGEYGRRVKKREDGKKSKKVNKKKRTREKKRRGKWSYSDSISSISSRRHKKKKSKRDEKMKSRKKQAAKAAKAGQKISRNSELDQNLARANVEDVSLLVVKHKHGMKKKTAKPQSGQRRRRGSGEPPATIVLQ